MLKFSEIQEIGQPFEIIRVGKWIHNGEPFEVTAATLNNIVNNFKTIRPKAPTKMVIDYNHGSAMSDNPEASKAAGWIKDLFVKENSLYAVPEWTEMAQNYIQNKEYGYASAELDLNYQDKENGSSVGTTLLAVALTNRPFIEGQEAIKLAEPTREELQKEAESRSSKYGIKVRDGGNLTIPSEYSDCKEGDFADPVNYAYPCNTPERAMAAYKYFSKTKNRSFYSAAEITKIEGRIKSHLSADVAKNAFKGEEKMDEDVKKVVELTETVNSQTKVIDEQKVKLSEQEGEIKKLTDESNKTKETLKLAEANEWINTQFNEHKIFPKEKDVLVKMYLMDSILAKEFIEKRGVVVPVGVTGEDVDDAKTTAEKQSAEIAKIKKFAEDNKITFPEARVKLLKEGK